MKVQLKYVDFVDSMSGNGIFVNDFQHGSSPMVSEAWLVDDEIVLIGKDSCAGKQLIVNRTQAKCWAPLHRIDWLLGEFDLPEKDQVELSKARAAKEKGKK
jgi:hypothetical protein